MDDLSKSKPRTTPEWHVIGGGSEVEERIEQSGTTVTVYRRRVRTVYYESLTHEPGFSFSDETTVYGNENTTRVTKHTYEINPKTNRVTQNKTEVTNGYWAKADEYEIADAPEE